MDNASAVDALLESNAKGTQEPLIDEDGNTIDTTYIMARMKDIGEKITQVSLRPPESFGSDSSAHDHLSALLCRFITI
jgi:hypothetical protein